MKKIRDLKKIYVPRYILDMKQSFFSLLRPLKYYLRGFPWIAFILNIEKAPGSTDMNPKSYYAALSR